MSDHLGRNPFQGKKPIQRVQRENPSLVGQGSSQEHQERLSQERPTFSRWLFVNLPAESFLFLLKATGLVQSTFGPKKLS